MQIVLAATGYHPTPDAYLGSSRALYDQPQAIILKDGTTLHTTLPSNADRYTIALENAGRLIKRGRHFLPTSLRNNPPATPPTNILPYEYCTCSPYRGYTLYDLITPAQIKTLALKLPDLCLRNDIPTTYDPELGDLCHRALRGQPGIFLASSFLTYRDDLHPQHDLIHLLKSLSA